MLVLVRVRVMVRAQGVRMVGRGRDTELGLGLELELDPATVTDTDTDTNMDTAGLQLQPRLSLRPAAGLCAVPLLQLLLIPPQLQAPGEAEPAAGAEWQLQQGSCTHAVQR